MKVIDYNSLNNNPQNKFPPPGMNFNNYQSNYTIQNKNNISNPINSNNSNSINTNQQINSTNKQQVNRILTL